MKIIIRNSEPPSGCVFRNSVELGIVVSVRAGGGGVGDLQVYRNPASTVTNAVQACRALATAPKIIIMPLNTGTVEMQAIARLSRVRRARRCIRGPPAATHPTPRTERSTRPAYPRPPDDE